MTLNQRTSCLFADDEQTRQVLWRDKAPAADHLGWGLLLGWLGVAGYFPHRAMLAVPELDDSNVISMFVNRRFAHHGVKAESAKPVLHAAILLLF